MAPLPPARGLFMRAAFLRAGGPPRLAVMDPATRRYIRLLALVMTAAGITVAAALWLAGRPALPLAALLLAGLVLALVARARG